MAPKRARRPRMLEWYRADRSQRLQRVLVLASALVAAGAVLGAAAIRWGHGLAFVALLLVASGGASAILGLWREMRQERWLALRTDGLVYSRDGRTRRMPWRFIEDVRAEGASLVIVLRSGKRIEIRERFTGTTRAALSQQIAQMRRRSELGLLR
jgi:hypothetical protein